MKLDYTLLLLIFIPLLTTVVLVYFLIKSFLDNENKRRDLELQKHIQKEYLPQKFQAYERIALFLERIRPSALVRRTEPVQDDLKWYEIQLMNTIQSEYEHNMSQQIYIHPETWKIVYSAKNATQNFIKQTFESLPDTADIQQAKEEIIKKSLQEAVPSNQAILYLQKDIQLNF